jgi:hypothetical protein
MQTPINARLRNQAKVHSSGAGVWRVCVRDALFSVEEYVQAQTSQQDHLEPRVVIHHYRHHADVREPSAKGKRPFPFIAARWLARNTMQNIVQARERIRGSLDTMTPRYSTQNQGGGQ